MQWPVQISHSHFARILFCVENRQILSPNSCWISSLWSSDLISFQIFILFSYCRCRWIIAVNKLLSSFFALTNVAMGVPNTVHRIFFIVIKYSHIFLFALVEGSASLHYSVLTTPFHTYFCSQAQKYRFDAVCHCTNPYRFIYLFSVFYDFFLFFSFPLRLCAVMQLCVKYLRFAPVRMANASTTNEYGRWSCAYWILFTWFWLHYLWSFATTAKIE